MSQQSHETIDVQARVELLDGEETEISGPIDRYAVPEAFLQHRFAPIETRFQHPVIPLDQRIILAGEAAERTYETVFQATAARFPLRATRLRDLYHRVQRARQSFLERQQREEGLRAALNEHANWVNRQVTQDLESRRAAHEEHRAVQVQEVQRLEALQAEAEAPHHQEIAHREHALAQARVKRAEERQAAIAAAEAAVDAADAAAVARHQLPLGTAVQHRDTVRVEIVARLEEEAAALRAEARSVEEALREQALRNEEALHAAYLSAADERRAREEAVVEARRAAAETTAAAGLLPEEARSDPRGRLQSRVIEAAVVAGEEADYPVELWTRLSWLKSVALLVATVACGSVFGLSLALLTGILRSLSSVGIQGEKTLVACGLGTFAFWLIGELVQRAVGLASETFHAGGNDLDLARRRKVWLGPLVLAFGVMGLIAFVEMAVERSGIVEAAVKGSAAYAQGQILGSHTPEWVNWFIAAVVSVPFVLFHGYQGWMDARYRIAGRRREGLVARARQEAVDNAAFRSFLASVHDVEHAESHLAALPPADGFPEVIQARRRVEEAVRSREEHPLLLRVQHLDAEMERRLEADPRVQHAESRVRAAKEALAEDAELQAARRRLERAQAAPEGSPEIASLDQAVAAARDALSRAPRGQTANIQVRRAQALLSAQEDGYTSEKTQLEKQRKLIRHAPDKHMRARIQDAREEWQAAQLLFDAELARVMRLLECPRYLQWWEHLRLYFSPDGFGSLSVPALPPAGARLPVRATVGAAIARIGLGAVGSAALGLLMLRLFAG